MVCVVYSSKPKSWPRFRFIFNLKLGEHLLLLVLMISMNKSVLFSIAHVNYRLQQTTATKKLTNVSDACVYDWCGLNKF